MSNEIDDKKLQQMLDDLPVGIEPETDLWPGVQRQLQSQPGRRSPWMGTALAASVLVSVLSVAFSSQLYSDRQALETQIAAINAKPSQSLLQPVSLGGADYSGQCSESGDQRVLRENIAIIQAALNQIQTGLQQQPGNPQLNGKLLDLSKQQAELVNRISTVSL